MTKKEIKNTAKSAKDRLINLMNASGYPYMYLLSRYFNERLLYRVSVSKYKDYFLLKGGSMLYAMDGLKTRPTIDVDFMANNISRDRPFLEAAFREIIQIPCKIDGVVFDVDSLYSEPIAIDKEYPGTRIFMTAHLDTIIHKMSIDICFGDIVSPSPQLIEFPLLLEDFPPINMMAYSLETVVAEKFHTMIDRDTQNSRMKDFFDCYQILKNNQFDNETLKDAIFATFDNRELSYNPDLQLFTASFLEDASRITRWNSFLRKIKWSEAIPFKEVMTLINDRLGEILIEYWRGKLS